MPHRAAGTDAHSGAVSWRVSTMKTGRKSEKYTSYRSDHSAEFSHPVWSNRPASCTRVDSCTGTACAFIHQLHPGWTVRGTSVTTTPVSATAAATGTYSRTARLA